MENRLVTIDKLRKDPITSGLIVALLTFIIGQVFTILYNLLIKNFKISDAFLISTRYLENEIKIKVLLIIIIILIIMFFSIRLVIRKFSKDPFKNINVREKIGEFKAGELFNILVNTEMKTSETFHEQVGVKQNLVQLFMRYQNYFNMGVDWNHPAEAGHYMYYVLGPMLMTYGLIEKKTVKKQFSIDDKETEEIIQTSEIGHKFQAFVEKVRLYTVIYPTEDTKINK
jgi:hypothetical protein